LPWHISFLDPASLTTLASPAQFGFYQGGIPTPMMEKCLLYKTVRYGEPGVPPLNPKMFKHAFTSKYGKVRIFKVMNVSKKSKDWVADPANRVCDAPGSWYCVGQYPPALQPLIAKRKPFKQLEDFNVGRDKESDEYVKEYHKRMEGRGGGEDYGEEDGFGGGRGGLGEQLGLTPKACYGREASLPKDKVYTGGAAGASLMQAMQFAAMQGKKNVAIARASAVDGHAFAFDGTPDPSGEVEFDDGCDMPCADSESLSCGCGDEVCAGAGAQPLPGENNARRWVVYEVPPEVAMLMEQQQRKSRKGSKGGKGGKGKKPKSEL